MARLLPTVLVLVLLAGTAAAFAVTERLKLEPAPLAVGQGVRVFSPVCGCETRRAELPVRVRAAGRLSVEIVRDDGETVRELLDRRVPAGRVLVAWDGRDEAGRVAPEGIYRPRVTLGAGRTFLLPTPLRLDVTPPPLTLVSARPRVLRRAGYYRYRRLVVRYRLGERARLTLHVGERARVGGRVVRRGGGHLDWWGRIDGRPAPPGRYAVTLVAVDVAGNRSQAGPVTVRVRP
ncbi:MAG: hypothetical protein ICV64_04320 [Thermoleophilia bacterium]|nr:hypothetical protein [Thermoleophilia bacterium]